jgi:acetyl esterase
VRIHRVIGALHGFTLLPRISRSLGGAYEVINAFLGDTPVAGEHPCPGQST